MHKTKSALTTHTFTHTHYSRHILLRTNFTFLDTVQTVIAIQYFYIYHVNFKLNSFEHCTGDNASHKHFHLRHFTQFQKNLPDLRVY
jgi:hypothetical protein